MNHFSVFKITGIMMLFVIFGCEKQEEFELPKGLSGSDAYPNTDAQFISISAVLGHFGRGYGDPIPFDAVNATTSEKYTEGYVVSSDEGGNFFKKLILQDTYVNPTAAIVVQIDKNPFFTQYEFGRKVYVKLNGLAVGEKNGVLQLGRLEGDELERIPNAQVVNHIIRTNTVVSIQPKVVEIADFNNQLESQYIRLNTMQFDRALMGLTFASEGTDNFDGERLLENCITRESVILSTSTYSDFKGLLLPENSGFIDGILTRDYYDDFYTLYLNSPEAIHFNNELPCN